MLSPVLATALGVLVAYSTFQPELDKQRQEKLGTFSKEHQSKEDRDKMLSNAIRSDLEEARQEALALQPKEGFAWGIRKWFNSKPQAGTSTSTPPPQSSPAHGVDQKRDDK